MGEFDRNTQRKALGYRTPHEVFGGRPACQVAG